MAVLNDELRRTGILSYLQGFTTHLLEESDRSDSDDLTAAGGTLVANKGDGTLVGSMCIFGDPRDIGCQGNTITLQLQLSTHRTEAIRQFVSTFITATGEAIMHRGAP